MDYFEYSMLLSMPRKTPLLPNLPSPQSRVPAPLRGLDADAMLDGLFPSEPGPARESATPPTEAELPS